MNKEISFIFIIIITLCVLLGILVVSEKNQKFEYGKAAYEAGVPAEANPSDSQSWLNGWIEAKEEDSK